MFVNFFKHKFKILFFILFLVILFSISCINKKNKSSSHGFVGVKIILEGKDSLAKVTPGKDKKKLSRLPKNVYKIVGSISAVDMETIFFNFDVLPYDSGTEEIYNVPVGDNRIVKISYKSSDDLTLYKGESDPFSVLGGDITEVVVPLNQYNNSPNIPSNPVPANDTTKVSFYNVSLSWTGGDPDEDNVVKYDIYFDDINASTLTRNNYSLEKFDTVNILDDHKYYWKIVAKDNYGSDTISPIWNFTTKPFSPIPVILELKPGNGKMDITWEPVKDVYLYSIYWAEGNSVTKSDSTIQIFISASFSYTISGLKNNTSYAFAIAAKTVIGGNNIKESDLSDVKTATPVEAPKPNAPVILDVISGNTEATINWGAVPGATLYKIYYAIGNSVTKFEYLKIDSTSSTIHIVTGLTNKTQYVFAVAAKNDVGESDLSNSRIATPKEIKTLIAPQNIRVTALDSKVIVNWDVIGGATSYNIYYAEGNILGLSKVEKKSINYPPLIVAELKNGTLYEFAVTAAKIDSEEESDYSEFKSAIPYPEPLNKPINVATKSGDKEVTVSWDIVAGATSYSVYYTAGDSTTIFNPAIKFDSATGITSSSYIIKELDNGTQYAIAVTAVNGTNFSGYSQTVTVTPAPQILLPPSSIIAIPGNAAITIVWTAVSGANSYNLYYKQGNIVTLLDNKKIQYGHFMY